MLYDFTQEEIERFHRNNISSLMDLYGKDKETDIRNLYQQKRKNLEATASVEDHIPQFTLQETKKILTQMYGKPQNN